MMRELTGWVRGVTFCIRPKGVPVHSYETTQLWSAACQATVCTMAESEFSEGAWIYALSARQRLDVAGDLAGGVAHQLKNALSVVNGYEELLIEALDAEPTAGEQDRQELLARARTVHTWTATALAVARRRHSLAAPPAC